MKPDLPFWVKQRQISAEEIATGVLKLSGPNIPEAVVGVRINNDLRWQGFVRETADGLDLDATDPVYPEPREALAAAFELYRNRRVN